MRSFPQTRLCRVVSVITAFTLGASTCLSTVSVAYAAEAVSSRAASAAPAPAAQVAPPAQPSVAVAEHPRAVPTVIGEDESLRSETATHYRLSDGTMKAVIQQAPVRFRDGSGAWRAIDTNLAPADASGGVASISTKATVRIGSQRSGLAPVSVSGDGYTVGIDYLGAAENAKLVVGDSATYLGVAHDTDLTYQALGDEVKETLFLKSADAPTSYRFALDAHGLELRRDFATGEWAFYRPGETTSTLTLGGLFVFDASESGAGEPASCSDTTMTVTPSGDLVYVTYEISRAWLSDPARVFPISVDPSLVGCTSTGDTYINSSDPASYGGWPSAELHVGYYGTSSQYHRAYLRFDVASAIPSDAYVTAAELRVNQFWQADPGTAHETYVASLQAGNTFSQYTSWNSQSSLVNNFTTKVYADSKVTTSVAGSVVAICYPVRQIVSDWVDATRQNCGFLLYQVENSSQDVTHYRRFRSSEYGTASARPGLTVDYTQPAYGQSAVGAATYTVGDSVTATVCVDTGWPGDVNAVSLKLRGTDGSGAKDHGTLLWTKTAPGAGRESTPCAGGAGGYVSFDPAGPGHEGLSLLAADCTAEISDTSGEAGDGLKVAFKFEITPEWGDVQHNDLVVSACMGPVDGNDASSTWSSGDKTVAAGFNVLPVPPVATASTTASAAWFTETDGNGDGIADSVNDATSGRGSAELSWATAAGATSYKVYLFDGNTYRAVGTSPGGSWSSAGKGIYRSGTQIAALAQGFPGDPYLSGSGLDLRDDPTSLYAKTPGTSVDGIPAYFFKVVSANSGGESALSSAATVTVQLASRTKGANDDVAHTTYDLGSVAGDAAAVELDAGVLTLDTTDLAIDSYGPAAALSRTYRSDVTSATLFAPGWRFAFEQSVATGPSASRLYTDERGERHRFLAAGADVWTAPHSMVATLTWSPAASTYALAFKGGDTLTFDSSGRLAKETDRHNQSVTYAWSAPGVVITAANGHQIKVTTAGTPAKVTKAEYTSGGLMR
jgi:hypothetical protein